MRSTGCCLIARPRQLSVAWTTTAMPPPSQIDEARSAGNLPRTGGEDAGGNKPGGNGSLTAAGASQPGLSPVGSAVSLRQPELSLVGPGASNAGGSGGSSTSGGSDGGHAFHKPPASCSGCQVPHHSELLLDGGDTEKGAARDWHRTWMRCFECYMLLHPKKGHIGREEAEAEFTRLVRNAGQARTSGQAQQRAIARVATAQQQAIARDINFTEVVDDVPRRLLAMDDPFRQSRRWPWCFEYVKEKDREAAEPGYAASPHVATVEDKHLGGRCHLGVDDWAGVRLGCRLGGEQIRGGSVGCHLGGRTAPMWCGWAVVCG